MDLVEPCNLTFVGIGDLDELANNTVTIMRAFRRCSGKPGLFEGIQIGLGFPQVGAKKDLATVVPT